MEINIFNKTFLTFYISVFILLSCSTKIISQNKNEEIIKREQANNELFFKKRRIKKMTFINNYINKQYNSLNKSYYNDTSKLVYTFDKEGQLISYREGCCFSGGTILNVYNNRKLDSYGDVSCDGRDTSDFSKNYFDSEGRIVCTISTSRYATYKRLKIDSTFYGNNFHTKIKYDYSDGFLFRYFDTVFYDKNFLKEVCYEILKNGDTVSHTAMHSYLVKSKYQDTCFHNYILYRYKYTQDGFRSSVLDKIEENKFWSVFDKKGNFIKGNKGVCHCYEDPQEIYLDLGSSYRGELFRAVRLYKKEIKTKELIVEYFD